MYGVIYAELIRGAGINFSPRPRPWAAHLIGLDTRWGFQRVFVKGVYDYTHARGKRGGRGIYIYFALAPGLYEVYYPISWRHERRYFVSVDPRGDIHEIPREKVVECLKNVISE